MKLETLKYLSTAIVMILFFCILWSCEYVNFFGASNQGFEVEVKSRTIVLIVLLILYIPIHIYMHRQIVKRNQSTGQD